MRTTLYLLMACLFSACNTIEYIGIETYNPAEITFPKNVDKVLIVNNAVPQPDDVGYTYNLYGTVQDTARAHADSALYDACHSLGKSIVDVSFFNDVLLYHDGTRQDTKYLVDEKLTPETVKELCREGRMLLFRSIACCSGWKRMLSLLPKALSWEESISRLLGSSVVIFPDGIIRWLLFTCRIVFSGLKVRIIWSC